MSELEDLRAKLDALSQEFEDYLGQRACGCGHPACTRCDDDNQARQALHNAL